MAADVCQECPSTLYFVAVCRQSGKWLCEVNGFSFMSALLFSLLSMKGTV